MSDVPVNSADWKLERLLCRIASAAFRAWPDADDASNDPAEIIDALITERDAARARAAGEWSPLDTLAADSREPVLVWLAEPSHGTQIAVMATRGVRLINGNFHWDMPKPTHWMPLPTPPVQS